MLQVAVGAGVFVGFSAARKASTGYNIANGVGFGIGTAVLACGVFWFMAVWMQHRELGASPVRSVTGPVRVSRRGKSTKITVGRGRKARFVLVPLVDNGLVPKGTQMTLYYLQTARNHLQSLELASSD